MGADVATDSRVLMIGLDAAEPRLVEEWTSEGRLPNLGGLLARGSYGRLRPPDGCLIGPPWPSFYTGTSLAEHGLYDYLVWDPERMTEVRPTAELLPLDPFWRGFGPDGPPVLVIDVPLVPETRPFHGVEITEWATHERLGDPSAYPPEILSWVERTLGPSPYREELHWRLPVRRLLDERDDWIHATERVAELARGLLEREPWELAVCCFSATHRAGHKLWSAASSTGDGTAEERTELGGALRAVYESVDRGVGRIVEAVDDDVTVLVFALHGMGPNCSHGVVLSEMLDRILSDGAGPEGRSAVASWLARARGATPLALRSELKRRLPRRLQDRLSAFWHVGGRDWESTRAICLTGNVHGQIRLNVAGREARGRVAPGDEYDEVCATISEGLRSFVDADTGDPVVDRVVRRDRTFPDGARADSLPDLTVVWADHPVAGRREIVSDRFGSIGLPEPGWNPDGRSGNHRPEGFLVAVGPGIETGPIEDATILDLAPTVRELLGQPADARMQGRALALRELRTTLP